MFREINFRNNARVRLYYANSKCFIGSFPKFSKQLYSKIILVNVTKQIHEGEFYENSIQECMWATSSDIIFSFSRDNSIS